jgi:hypothetical protein
MACCDLPAVGFGMERDAGESLGKKTLWSGNIWERETVNKGGDLEICHVLPQSNKACNYRKRVS